MVLWWFDLRVVVEAGGLAAGKIEEGEGCAEAAVGGACYEDAEATREGDEVFV